MGRAVKSKKRTLRGRIEISPYPTLCGNSREEMERYKWELFQIVCADYRKLYYLDYQGIWRLRTPEQLAERERIATKYLHRDKEGTLHYELHDKIKAASDLFKIFQREDGRNPTLQKLYKLDTIKIDGLEH